MTKARQAIIASLVLLGMACATSAHPIVIHTGEIRWDERGLRIVLTFDEHSLRHETDAVGGGATSKEVIRTLVESIEVVTHNHGRIIPTTCNETTDAYIITCDYDVAAETSAVAVLHRPTDQTAQLPRQFQLTRQASTGESTRLFRLTSRGNHAVLLRDEATDSNALIDPFNEPVIRLEATNESTLAIHVDFPLTVLATWPNLLSVDADTFTMQQFKRSRMAVSAWAKGRLSVIGPEGMPCRMTVPQVTLIDPAGDTIDESKNRPVSLYTTRLRLRYDSIQAAPIALTAITWNGFNAAVLRIPVTDNRHDQETLIGNVTIGQLTLNIDRHASR